MSLSAQEHLQVTWRASTLLLLLLLLLYRSQLRAVC
jgi:hypothetical protein